MTKRILFLGFLVFAFVAQSADCQTPDTWASVTSIDQLDGTWKGSISETMTISEYFSVYDEFLDQSLKSIYDNDVHVTITYDLTIIISAEKKSFYISGKEMMVLSGRDVSSAWEAIKNFMHDGNAVIDDAQHTIIRVGDLPSQIFPDDFIDWLISSVVQINQDGTKVILPDDSMMNGSSHIIMTKQ